MVEAPTRAVPKKPAGPFQVAAFNLLLPGAGTLLAKRRPEGYTQLVSFVVGILTSPFLFGLALVAGSWAWSQISTVEFLSRRRAGA